MNRRTPPAALAFCGLLLLFGARASAQEVSLGGPRQKITTASFVRARSGPQFAAQEVARLKLGTVVSATARSADRAEVGGKTDYWYRVELPAGGTGWVFGGLLADYEPAGRREIVRRIIEERLKVEGMSFEDGADLFEFVSGALAEAGDAQARGELELARLHALGLAVTQMPVAEQQRPAHREFQKAHGGQIYYHEFAGVWAVSPESFWSLEAKYRGTPVGDRIAWDAAHALRQGECEGNEVCDFLALQESEGKYLALYPQGARAGEALQNIAQALSSQELDATLKRRGGDKYAAEEREALAKGLAELRAAVSKTNAAERAAVLKRLDQLTPRAR